MLSTLINLIVYPIQELLKLMADSRLTDFLGVSLIACLVTCFITIIVVRSLINPIVMGRSLTGVVSSSSSKSGKSDNSKPSGSGSIVINNYSSN